MRVKFTRTYKVKAKGGETYEEGRVYDLTDASAQHFINRGAAVEVAEAESKAGRRGRGQSAASEAGGESGSQSGSEG